MKAKTKQSKINIIICPNCDGAKIDPDTEEKCLDCNGTGQVTIVVPGQRIIPRRK